MFSKTDYPRIEDNDKLREKVDEALTVFNEYQKAQGSESATQESGPAEQQANGESEEVKA